MLRLADIRTVYALDLPGHGDSPPLDGTITPTRLAEIVAAFADALDLDTYDLNGHSYSATVAAYIAVGWDDRVSRLLLTCPSTYRDEKERHLVTRVHKIAGLWVMLRGGWMGRYSLIYKRIAGMLFHQLPLNNQEVQATINDFLRMDRHTGIQLPLNATMPNYLTILQRVPVPTLVVGARQDSVMPAYGPPTVAKLIRQSHLAWIDQCGHLPMVERPQDYHDIVREFLVPTESPSDG
jgi:pimeloyl-ACP methyl ester carboxylesterase